jgi:hypothetical protein
MIRPFHFFKYILPKIPKYIFFFLFQKEREGLALHKIKNKNLNNNFFTKII